MHDKGLAIFFIILGGSGIALWFIFRKKRMKRIDPLEVEIPFLAIENKVRVITALIASIIFFIIGLTLLFDK